VYTALITPFKRTGALNLRVLPDLIRFQRKAGVDGILVGGTNGEGISLSVRERKRLLEAVLTHADGLEVIAATGACAITDAIELTRHASYHGVAALLVLPPFYFKEPEPRGVAAYYAAVAAATELPLILYSIPQFSGVPVGGEVLDQLAHCRNIYGVKESSPASEPAYRLLRDYPSLRLFVGNDLYLSELLQAGAAGVISGTANAFPELVVAVARAVRERRDPWEAQERLNSAISVIADYPIVGTVKSILAARGVARTYTRAPLVMPSPAQRRTLLSELKRRGLL